VHTTRTVATILTFYLLLVGFVGATRVNAQSPEVQQEVILLDATVSSVLRKDQEGTRISELRELYKSQIEVYRSSEQQYKIAKEQHARLQTLASLEEAVRATREALLNRSRVLVTYIQMSRLTLADIPGVELSQKNLAVSRMDTVERKLLDHQDSVLNTQTREQIAARVEEFALLQDELEAAIYLSQSLISHGKVQTIYDQALIVQRDIQTYHNDATASALIEAERTRAHAETIRNFEQIKTELRTVMLRIIDHAEEFDTYNKNNHERMADDLELPHVHLTQLVGFLEELLRL